MSKSRHSRIYNKFEWWSVADCDCKWCRYHRKKSGCVLDECCCADIRAEAYRRERESKMAANAKRIKREMEIDAGSDE